MAKIRLSRGDREAIAGFVDMPLSATESLLNRLEDAVNQQREVAADCADWPTPTQCAEALAALRQALAAAGDIVSTNAAFVALEGASSTSGDIAEQIDRWQVALRAAEQNWSDLVHRGRPPLILRERFLTTLCMVLDDEGVERADQPFVIRRVCEVAGVSLPGDNDKLLQVLARIRQTSR